MRFFRNTANVSSLLLVKITTKSTNFLPAKKKIPILKIELQTNKIQKVTSKHQALKFENCEERSNIIFQKTSYFHVTVVFCLLAQINAQKMNFFVKNLFNKCEHIRIKRDLLIFIK